MGVELLAMQSAAMKGDVWFNKSKCIRWAVNVADWTPTEKQWTKAIASLQVNFSSLKHSRGFCFKNDEKFVRNWSEIGQKFVKNWTKVGLKMVKNWSKICQKLDKSWSNKCEFCFEMALPLYRSIFHLEYILN